MIRRLIVPVLAATLAAPPVLAAPAQMGPADGWAEERARLDAQRRSPVATALLNTMWPGIGTAYAGEPFKAVAQAAGAFGVIFASMLVSSWIAGAGKKEAAAIVAVAPIAAYWSWGVTDGYLSIAWRNERIDLQQAQIMPVSLLVPVATF